MTHAFAIAVGAIVAALGGTGGTLGVRAGWRVGRRVFPPLSDPDLQAIRDRRLRTGFRLVVVAVWMLSIALGAWIATA